MAQVPPVTVGPAAWARAACIAPGTASPTSPATTTRAILRSFILATCPGARTFPIAIRSAVPLVA